MSTTIVLGVGGVAVPTRLDLPVPGSMAAVVHGEFARVVLLSACSKWLC